MKTAAIVWWAAILLSCGVLPARNASAKEPDAAPLRSALVEMEQWLKAGGQLEGWRAFLLSNALEAELAKGVKADRAVLKQVLDRYANNTPGLDQPPFVATREALERWLDDLSAPTLAELPDVCRGAKGQFTPVTEKDVEQARAALVAAFARLDRRLSGDQSAAWREFLQWPVLQAELRKPRPDPAGLDAVYARYAAGHEGLELVHFAEVRRALRQYLITARAAASPSLKSQCETVLDKLAGLLQAYAARPSGETAMQIGLVVEWLDSARQAPALRKAIERHFREPNCLALVSGELLAAGMGGAVDETSPVEDVILGSSVRGTGRTRGQATVELVPSAGAGELDLVFRGTTESDATSYGNGATVRSSSTTRIEARKRLRTDGRRVTALPAAVSAGVQTTFHSVDPGRGGNRAQQEAWRRAQAQKPQSEQEASDHARQQTAGRIDREAGQQVAWLNQSLDRWWGGLEDRGGFPEMLRAHTAADALHWTALQTGPGRIAAPDAPPILAGKPDFALQIHESLVTNTSARVLPGMILQEDRCRAWLADLLGPLPERFQRDPDQEPWTIRLAQQLPVTARFRDGTYALTIRGDRYTVEGGELPALDVTVAYKIVQEVGRLKAVRQGPPQIFPRGFTPGSPERLSARQQALRTVLQRRLGKLLDAEWVPGSLTLPEPWNKAGGLELVQWEADRGWLVMAWKRALPPSPAAR